MKTDDFDETPSDEAEEAPELRTEEYVDFESLKEKVKRFVRERDWEKYHNPKDIAIDIAVEASELLELFQWMKDSESEKIKENEEVMQKIKDEVADVISACLHMANALDLNIAEIVVSKLKQTEKKYPKDKYKGIWKKPSE